MKLNIGLVLTLALLGCTQPQPVGKAASHMKMAAAALPEAPAFSAMEVPPGFHRVSLRWHYYPGWETNGISFNVREFPDNDNQRPLISCHVLTNVHALSVEFYAHPGLWRGVTATNFFTGEETAEGIAPVGQITYEEIASQ